MTDILADLNEEILRLGRRGIDRGCQDSAISAAVAEGAHAEISNLRLTVQHGIDVVHAAEAEIERLRAALTTAFVAMKLAAALPGVSSEYDFGPAVASAERALYQQSGSTETKS